ncbi:glycosyltransferase family 2 protein [Streptomyces hiroshimensis]|uniref:Integral membrane regulatory protein n=1 Tax=Streptomyces hiroshimensis TaxID=66424 RepID=A0ABQ2Y918_9ACTN|nr:glycosyltransferase [Streptomyces hiroshimensis]GGX76710.1 integral membrane regulatory protein [Streptomyces hiroshimensis]
MSVHSNAAHSKTAAASAAPTRLPTFDPAVAPAFPRHVVTAVIVSHDGARWLPDAIEGLLGQERSVQSAVGADTGSADDSAQLLADALGPDRVLHLARRAGFGTAVEEALRAVPAPDPEELPYLKRSSGWDPVSRTWREDAYDQPGDGRRHGDADLEPVQWLWLLHDDCAPEPGALHELLRVAESEPEAAVLGPKLRGWYDRRQLLETGVSIARSGRRWTGLDRREQDQGQHDQVRTVLSVSTAGMLVRRDVFEELGGFDPRLPLMRDDVDLCWRAHAAGHRVLVAPDAVLRHAEAAARERRPVDCAGRRAVNPHRIDKAGAVHTLLANTRGPLLAYVLLRLVLGTLLHALGYLLGKAPAQAFDELAGLFGVLLRPGRIRAARAKRGAPAVAPGDLRPLFPPPGATLRATAEQLASNFGGRWDDAPASGGRHGAVESGPTGEDADFLEIEQFARLKRLVRKPAPVLFGLLLIVSVVACRQLFGGGSLSGGALLPAPDGASALWAQYTDGWHAVGVGSTGSAPPYLAVLATLSTLFLGSTGFTLTLLLVCSVPLAGLTAYFASRPLVSSRPLRAWAAVAYAFLPAATGALAAGRLGTAVLAILLPLMARTAVAATGLRVPGARPTWRASWAYALLLTVTTAFTPVVWPLAVVLGLGALALHGAQGGRARLVLHGPRFLAVVLTPVAVLAPWSPGLFAHPGRFLTEAGIDRAVTGASSPLHLLTADPGGSKAVGGLLLAGVVLAALAALLRADRQLAVRGAWVAALAALAAAVLTARSSWAGPATLVYGLALIAAAAVGAEGARARVAALSFGWRQPVAALIALAAAAAPLVAAVAWAVGGADGPLKRRDPAQVPAFVAEEAATRDRARTLVLDGRDGRVSYALVRGSGARLGDAEAAAAAGADPKLDSVVAGLVAGSGADQADLLGGYAVGYVLVRNSAPAAMSRVLDTTPGLTRLSRQDDASLWRVDREVARITVVAGEAQGGAQGGGQRPAPVPVAAGPVEARATLPAGPAGRVLRIADKAAPGWQATLDGRALKSTTVDGWAQGFELPAGGGKLALTYKAPTAHTAWLWTQGLLAAVLVVLALPGRKRQVDDDLPEAGGAAVAAPEPTSVPAQAVAGEGRRARRLRAAAEAARPDAAGTPEEPPAEPVADSFADPYAAPYADSYVDPYADPYGQQQTTDPYAEMPQPPPQQQQQQQYGQEMPYGSYGEQHYHGGHGGHGGTYDAAYGDAQQQVPYQGQYQEQPYATGAYDPYTYGGAHDTTYGGGDRHHRDGSEQQ